MFYNKIYSKVKENIESKPGFLQSFIDQAIQTKIWNFLKTGSVHHTFYDWTIFALMKKALGGRVRMLVSSGAPLRGDVKNFLAVVFSSNIFECMGMTEAAGCLTSTAIWEKGAGHVGGILPCLRM